MAGSGPLLHPSDSLLFCIGPQQLEARSTADGTLAWSAALRTSVRSFDSNADQLVVRLRNGTITDLCARRRGVHFGPAGSSCRVATGWLCAARDASLLL